MSVKNKLENKRLRREANNNIPAHAYPNYWVTIQSTETNKTKVVSQSKAGRLCGATPITLDIIGRGFMMAGLFKQLQLQEQKQRDNSIKWKLYVEPTSI